MPWYLLHDENGRLLSQGSVLAEKLAANVTVVTLDKRPERGQIWDEASRQFVAKPAPVFIDRLDDLQGDGFAALRTLLQSLTAPQRTVFRNAIIKLLGKQRYRQADEATEL